MSPQTVLVLIVTLVCAYTDWRHSTVYNSLTYPAALVGLFLSFIIVPPDPWGSFAGFAAALLCFGVLWYVGGMGAGDVKLLAAVGALKGLPFVLYSSIYVLFIASLAGIVILALTGRLWRTIRWIFFTLISLFVPGMSPPALTEKTYIPFAPFIFLGTTTAICLEYLYGPYTF